MQKQSGMSLLEVLIALTLMSSGIVVCVMSLFKCQHHVHQLIVEYSTVQQAVNACEVL